MHISLPPSAYVMKVKLPRLKQEPSSDSDSSSEEEGDGEAASALRAKPRRAVVGELAETERYQAQLDSLVEELGTASRWGTQG